MKIYFLLAVLFSTAFSAQTFAQQGAIQIHAPLDPSGRRTVEPDWAEIKKSPLGSVGNPVRASGEKGEQAYVQRLVCADGAAPEKVTRVGPMGIGPYEAVVDLYNLSCNGKESAIFLDMYHPGFAEKRPVVGFRLNQEDPPAGTTVVGRTDPSRAKGAHSAGAVVRDPRAALNQAARTAR